MDFTGSPRVRTLCLVVLLVTAAVTSIELDIPVLRQALGFLMLTILPGALILAIMKPEGLGGTVRALLAVGLSVALVLVVGLLINWIYPLLGCDEPLSERSITLTFSLVLLALGVVGYFTDRASSYSLGELLPFNLTVTEKGFLVLPSLFPLLSIVGMYVMNRDGSNAVVMALLLLLPAYAVLVTVWHKRVSDRVYPLTILLMGVSLTLILGMRSRHLLGIDVHSEYYLFLQTLHDGRWQVFLGSIYDGCLSISILPVVYHSVLDIDPEQLFKVLYPLIFSAAPVVVYVISRQFVRSHYAFLAALFFMSQKLFLFTTGNARSSIAALFFGLAILALCLKGLSEFNRTVLFVVFAAACTLSHYTTSYIFLVLLVVTWIAARVAARLSSRVSRSLSWGSVNLSKVTFLFAFIFFWQGLTIKVGFTAAVRFIGDTMESIWQFFRLEARGETAAAALGMGIGEKGIPQQIEFVFSWLTILLVGIGVVAVFVHYIRRLVSHRADAWSPPDFMNRDFDLDFLMMSLVAITLLAVSLALPYVFAGFGMDRAFLQMGFILSVFFAIGGIIISRIALRRAAGLLVFLILVPYYLCVTGVLYQALGSPREVALNSTGFQYDMYYVADQEVASARWVAENVPLSEEWPVQVDHLGGTRLISQGEISPRLVEKDAFDELSRRSSGYFFLTYTNVVEGRYMTGGEAIGEREMGEIQELFRGKSRIYSNGGSEIWK